jgi:hypothetical protein
VFLSGFEFDLALNCQKNSFFQVRMGVNWRLKRLRVVKKCLAQYDFMLPDVFTLIFAVFVRYFEHI